MNEASGKMNDMDATEPLLVYPVDRSWRNVRTTGSGEVAASDRTLLHRAHPEGSFLEGVAWCTGGKGGRITALVLEDALSSANVHSTRLCRRCFPKSPSDRL